MTQTQGNVSDWSKVPRIGEGSSHRINSYVFAKGSWALFFEGYTFAHPSSYFCAAPSAAGKALMGQAVSVIPPGPQPNKRQDN